MQLSDKALQDLKKTLIKEYGSYFGLSDKELNEVGILLLTILAEGLKLRAKSC